MSKGKIITISIILCIVTTFTLLFGVFFRVKTVEIKQVNDIELSVSKDNILAVANLQNKATFFIDKEATQKAIEQKYSKIKVVQIKTISPNSIEIVARNRENTYCILNNDTYYYMDEELRVLDKSTVAPTETIIKLTIENENIEINDYLENQEIQSILYNFYIACYKSKINVGYGMQNINRAEIVNFVKTLKLEKRYTLNDEYYSIILETSTGAKIEIDKASVDIDRKINICFATYSSGEIDTALGAIKLFYDAYGVEHIGYQK